MKLFNHPTHAAAILKTVGEAIITVDVAQVICFANSQAERIFGYAADELNGLQLQALIPEPYRARHAVGFARAVASEELQSSGGYVEFEGLRQDGAIFPLELRLLMGLRTTRPGRASESRGTPRSPACFL